MSVKEIKSENLNYSRLIKNVFLGLVAGIMLCLILILIFAFILARDTSDMNINNMAYLLGNIAIALSAFSSGLFASIKNKSRGLMTGIICGILYFLVLALISILIPDSLSEDAMPVNGALRGVLIFVLTVIFGGIGGVFGVNIGKKRKRN